MFFTKEDFALFGDNYIEEALASNSIYSVSATEYISAENVDKALATLKIVKVKDVDDSEFYLKRDIALEMKNSDSLIIVEGTFLTHAYYVSECNKGNIVECDRCHELMFKDNAVVTETGETLCLHHAKKYFKQCEECGKWYPKTMFREIEGRSLCLSCISRVAFYCDNCHQYHLNSEPSHQVHNGMNNETWCDTCFNENATECAHCHTFVPSFRINSRTHFCPTCTEAFASPIHRYGYKPVTRFYGDKDTETTLYFGMELETDNGNNEDFARALLTGCDIEDEHYEPVKEVYCKADGSLTYQGCEVVCHPCTLEYHLSDNSFWNTVTRLAGNYGMKSHDALRSGEHDCGLHIHVSRRPFETNNIEDYEEKIAVAFEKFKDEWQKIARRKNNHYARFFGENEKEALKREMRYSDRYHAVNIQNSSTVEIRIFRGTLNLDTLKATFWAVGNMCERILNGMDTNTVENFLDLFDMASAPDYVTAYFTKKKLIPEATEATETAAEPVEMPMAV